MATSKDITLAEDAGGDMRAEPRETLSLVATLYRVGDGSFQVMSTKCLFLMLLCIEGEERTHCCASKEKVSYWRRL